MSKAMAKSNNNLIVPKAGSWGSKVHAENLIMPKILLQQKMSERVEDGKAKPGDMVDNLTDDVIGTLDKQIEFIPFRGETQWIERKNGDFSGILPFEGNETLPFKDTIDGQEIERDKVINIFVLLPAISDVPYIIPFKRTSMKAGKKVETRMWRNEMAGLNPCEYSMKLTAKKVAGDKGTYYIYEVNTGRKASDKEAIKCYKFNESILSGQRKVDYADEVTTPPTADIF